MSRSIATNWTGGDRRGKEFQVDVQPRLAMPDSLTEAALGLRLSYEADDDEHGNPIKKRMSIMLSRSDAFAIWKQVECGLLALAECPQKGLSGRCEGPQVLPCDARKACSWCSLKWNILNDRIKSFEARVAEAKK